MHQRYLILFIFFLSIPVLYCQEELSLFSVDRQTYEQWQAKDWNGLIQTGKQALQQDIDFYYLRVRLGIAFFEKKNYHKAIEHFNKAYQSNQQEDYIKEYLYFSYLYAGRDKEATIIASTFSPMLAEKNLIKPASFAEKLDVVYTTQFIANPSVIDNYQQTAIPAGLYGSQYISSSLGSYHIGLKHDIGKKVSLYHTFNRMNKSSLQYVVNQDINYFTKDFKNYLNQYYLSASWRIARQWSISSGFHYINTRIPQHTSTFGQGRNRTTTSVITDNDFLGFLSVYKDITYFSLGFTVSLAGINNNKQLQSDLSLVAYPLGNLNVYSSSTFSLQHETTLMNETKQRVVFHQLVGIKLLKRLWSESYLSLGEIKNYAASSGMIIYNNAETITSILGTSILLPLNKTWKFSLNYSNSAYQSNFNAIDGTLHNAILFNNHSITGGISCHF